jgi:hypothetical protein
MQEKLIADHSQDYKRSNKQPIGADVSFFDKVGHETWQQVGTQA